MSSQFPLTPIAEAQARLLAQFSPLTAEVVPLAHAIGRVLAEEIISQIDLPAFANSSMDGFAVRALDVLDAGAGQRVTLKVVADIPAGRHPEGRIGPGQAARIMTGAPIPEGADAVIPVEDTNIGIRPAGVDVPETVQIYCPAAAGANLRSPGQDVCKGDTVLTPGRRLRPQDVGVLAMLGVSQIPVYRQPRAGILSPGDELLPPGAPIQPGKIYDANSYVLRGLVTQTGGLALPLGIIPDDFAAVRQSLDAAIENGVDFLLSSGGVSVGAFDFVRAVLEQAGELTLWRVNMRPGKPLAFGRYRGVPYFGLPGNPVSAYVGFQVFVKPALIKMMGLPQQPRLTRPARLLEAIESDGRESYLRAYVVRETEGWVASLTGHQGSGNLRSFVQANALVIVPAGVKHIPAGSQAEAWFFDGL